MGSRILATCFALLSVCAVAGAGEPKAKEPTSPEVFFDARKHRTEYAGPGREDPSPTDVPEVLIGYFGPDDPAHPDGGHMWSAAQLAVDQANRQGGYRGKSFRLVPAWSENPWGTGVAKVAQIVYSNEVWAIVGGIDGPSTHLAEQVVAKARLALLSPASTDKTVNLANVPWMFSCVPGDHLQAPVLAAEIDRRVGKKPLVLLSADDHDSRQFTAELGKCFVRHRLAPKYHFPFKQGALDADQLAARIVPLEPSAVVLVAGAHDSARLVAALRQHGFGGQVFGTPSMGRRRFLQEAGEAAEGVVFPLPCDPAEMDEQFVKTFTSRFGRPPDYAAAHTYDAVRLLIAAMRKAGLNRARIRDAVSELSPWAGVTGTIEWDLLGGNTRPARLATIHDGRVIALARKSESPAASPAQ